jgi:hypothetical protein
MRTWVVWVALVTVGCGDFKAAEDGTGGMGGEGPALSSGGSESVGGSLAASGGHETGGEPGTGGAEAAGGNESGGASTGGVESSGGASGGQPSGGAPASGGVGSGGEVAGSGGATCACTEGPCCDGCDFKPDTFQCADDEIRNPTCSTVDAAWCASPGKQRINREFFDVWCSGASAGCDGLEELDYSGGYYCDGTDVCLGDPGEAYCAQCGP